MYIISIATEKREKEIPDVQEILTEYGENIISRLGIHNCKKDNYGLIIIVYDAEDIEEFVEKLNVIKGINVNYMEA